MYISQVKSSPLLPYLLHIPRIKEIVKSSVAGFNDDKGYADDYVVDPG